MSQEFQMGLIQREWVKSLKLNGEIQINGRLGTVSDTVGYIACCLGELLVTECRVLEAPPPLFNNTIIVDGGIKSAAYLYSSHERLGLKDFKGTFIKKHPLIYRKKAIRSLAHANDSGVPWAVIAEFIESDPANVFTHPY